MTTALQIIFDGPPGPEGGRFVEVETPSGKSVRVGYWERRSDGYWILVLTPDDFKKAGPLSGQSGIGLP